MKKYYEFTEAEQQSVFTDYYEECMSLHDLGLKYETSQYHIQKIIGIFAAADPEKVKLLEKARVMKQQNKKAAQAMQLPNDVESLKNEVLRLQQDLKTAQLREHAFNTMIDVAEEMFNIPIRKKLGAKQ